MKPYHFDVDGGKTHVRVTAANAKEARAKATAVLITRQRRKNVATLQTSFVLVIMKPGELFVKKEPE